MDIVERIVATTAWLRALGQDVRDLPHCRIVRNPGQPLIWDANHASLIRARTDAEMGDVLGEAKAALSHCSHSVMHVDPLTPALVEARLAMEGYDASDATLEMVLSGPIDAHPATIDIRPVKDEHDWQSFDDMLLTNFIETGPKDSRTIAAPVTKGLVAIARTKAPDFQIFIARVDGEDCGYGAGGFCPDGLGLVEDIYTKPAFRKRGVATAIIAHAVDFARAAGGGDVLIGTDVASAPKRLYASLGFHPACITRQYLKPNS